ncbi:hypothetical protein ScPMuIL_010797 [Solemya velum]
MWILCLLLIVRVLANKECPKQEDVSRDCRKACVTDSDCVSQRKRCLCDGACGKSCLNPDITCSRLGLAIHNGWVEHSGTTIGAVATYHCIQGYSIVGNTHRVCQGDEQWSGEQPECVLISNGTVSLRDIRECSEPPFVLNSAHDGPVGQRRYEVGTAIDYHCIDGFEPSGPPPRITRAWCRSGGWIGPQLTCTYAGCSSLPELKNGWKSYGQSSAETQSVTFHCNSGFSLSGSRVRTCDEGGSWSGYQPTCENVVCPHPPIVSNAKHDGLLGQEHYPTGSELFYDCFVGFLDGGDPLARCNNMGQWIGPSLRCSVIRCEYPGDIDNGRRIGYNFTYSNQITYLCDDGYELIGSHTRVCLATGRWSASEPHCHPIQCPELQAPLYGRMIGWRRNFDAEMSFECDDGFMLKGPKRRRCQADKTWSGIESTCGEIDCGWPGPIWNGKIIGERTNVGAILNFNCNVYTNFAGPSLTTQCNPNGEWSYPPPICWGQCQIHHIPNATLLGDHVEGKWIRHDTFILFQCKNGLVRNNLENVRCNNGSWTYTPMCIPAHCDSPPPSVDDGLRVYFGRGHGDKAKYMCFPGYRLENIDTINFPYLICQYGGWHGGYPKCTEKYCPNPGSLSHGTIFKKGISGSRFLFKPYIKSIRHGYQLIFECDEDYHLDGATGSTCVDGSWQPSPSLTKCVKTMHPKFEKLWRPLEEMNAV